MGVATEGASPIFCYELRDAVLMVYVANEWAGATRRTFVFPVGIFPDLAALIKGGASSGLTGA